MRINNNMLALNTHRQLGGVSLAQAKSMEKLSSGYRINRAGDDAAGLAISEKMRAQIRGLTTAAKNAQDGISLIQTAEGALQEVHGMLNRMVELATQSANGTMDDEVDRKNLESELTALKDEITRVAKSSNFNGIELLDGSLASSAVKSKIANVVVHGITGAAAAGANDVITYQAASDAKFSAVFNTNGATQNAQLAFTANNPGEVKSMIFYNDEAGERHKMEINLVAVGDSSKKVDWTKSSVKIDGKAVELKNMDDLVLDGAAGNTTMALNQVLNNVKGFSDQFEVTMMKDKAIVSNGTFAENLMLKIESKSKGTKAEVLSVTFNKNMDPTNADNSVFTDVLIEDLKKALEEKITVNGTKIIALSDTQITNQGAAEAILKAAVEVDGEKFVTVLESKKNDPSVIDALKKAGIEEGNIVYVKNAGGLDAADVKTLSKAINQKLDKEVAFAETTDLIFKGETIPGKAGEGLTLQVGESSEAFQKINVKVNDMSSKGLGISSISVATQEKAASSLAKIREAINTVSSTRGDLGALQNRLEHTIANLNVTAENITASESRIRDVDMAKEMVELTKTNILQQAAQAMLAQANQAPQGVLQLLR